MSRDEPLRGAPGRPAEECSHSGSITCREALERVHEYLDGELAGVAPADIQAHFEACARCYPHLRLEQSFRRVLCRALSRQTAPPELRTRLKTLLDQAASER